MSHFDWLITPEQNKNKTLQAFLSRSFYFEVKNLPFGGHLCSRWVKRGELSAKACGIKSVVLLGTS